MTQIRKNVSLNKDDIDWFHKTYGEEASLSWVLTLLLSEYKKIHDKTPAEYAEIAAKQLVESQE